MDPAPATEAGGEATQPSTNLRSRNGGIPSPPASESDPLMADSPSSEARQERGKGKAEQAGADAEDKPSSRAMEPVALPCGHVFCEKCIDNWMKSNRSCPICRRDPTRPDDADGGDDKGGGGGGGNGCRDAGDSQGASSSRHSSTWRRPYRGWRMGSGIEAELAYRLMRLQVQHTMLSPLVIPQFACMPSST